MVQCLIYIGIMQGFVLNKTVERPILPAHQYRGGFLLTQAQDSRQYMPGTTLVSQASFNKQGSYTSAAPENILITKQSLPAVLLFSLLDFDCDQSTTINIYSPIHLSDASFFTTTLSPGPCQKPRVSFHGESQVLH